MILRFLWKWLVCSWFHRKDLCYPEVWGRGLKGPWHCMKCHPCGEELAEIFGEAVAEETLDRDEMVHGVLKDNEFSLYSEDGELIRKEKVPKHNK